MDDARAAEAQAILWRHKAVDIGVRGKLYRDSGWSRFDDTAPVYTAEQVAHERSLYR